MALANFGPGIQFQRVCLPRRASRSLFQGFPLGIVTVEELAGFPVDRFSQCGSLKSLTVGAVEQNRIGIHLPNRGQFYAPWSVQAKQHTTGAFSAFEQLLRDLEDPFFEVIFQA
jgi:hypothetical protein